MLNKLKFFFNHRIVKSVALVVSGTAFAQVLGAVLSPIITRLYEPSAFGVFGVFSSVVMILSSTSDFAYSYAIVLPKRDVKALAIMSLSNRLSFYTCLGVAFFLYFFNAQIADIFQLKIIESVFWLLPIVALSIAFQAPLTQWLIRNKRFKQLSKITIVQAIIVSLLKIAGGIFSPDALTLILVFAFSQLFALAIIKVITLSEITNLLNNFSKQMDKFRKEVAKNYYDFPLFRAPQLLLSSVSAGLPMLAFAAFFSPDIVGLYALANKIVKLPGVLVSKALGLVILPEMAETSKTGRSLKQKIVRSTKILALSGCLPFVVLFWLGPEIFSFVFGKNWAIAGEYASILSIPLFFRFLNVPATQALVVTKNQHFLLVWGIITTIMNFVIIISFANFSQSPEFAILGYSIFGAISYIFLIFWAIKKSNGYVFGGENV